MQSIVSETKNINYEIIIVDNDSQDNSERYIKEIYADITWINMGYNSGFARANNAGIKKANGRYILLLNSDTEIIDNAIEKTLHKYIGLEKNNKIGFLGCKMIDYNNNVLFNSNIENYGLLKILKGNPIYIKLNRKRLMNDSINLFNKKKILHNQFHQSKWLGAAYLLFDADICKKYGMFLDEDFFMYGEDKEWCYRLLKQGYIHYFTPEALIYHANCSSPATDDWKHGQTILSEGLFFLKAKGKFYYSFCIAAILLNHFFDSIFYLKQRILNKINEVDDQSKKIRKFEIRLIRRYFFNIIFNYSRKPSSSKNFLKYVLK
ncbi:MAG: glycosyltransferase [Bacteroidia bacterium]|nr:glycosyltransferase [Bacteroidia bacterium]